MQRIITQQEIQKAILEMADELNRKFVRIESPVIVISVMNGSLNFTKDLTERLHFPVIIETVKYRSYTERQRGEIQGDSLYEQIPRLQGLDQINCNFIVLDDICDSGKTFIKIANQLQFPNNITFCSLLVRQGEQRRVNYHGFVVEQGEWAVGYGMDDENGLNRNLTHIILNKK